MTAREERFRKAHGGNLSPNRDPHENAANRDVGWGFGIGTEADSARRRKAVFAAAALVMGSLGFLFLVWTLSAGGPSRRMLAANSSARRPAGYFTVKLLEFAATGSKRQDAERLCGMEPVKSLAAGNEFYFVPLPGGRVALCVGRFERPDSPQLLQLLRGFQNYTDRGSRAFAAASVLELSG